VRYTQVIRQGQASPLNRCQKLGEERFVKVILSPTV
jgi:hypothetical protein